jgi:hypothetical protein
MSGALQSGIVALAVLVCALYSTWRLLSARLRLRVLARLAMVPGIAGAAWFSAWRARLAGGSGAGCSSCAPTATIAASRKQTPGALRR